MGKNSLLIGKKFPLRWEKSPTIVGTGGTPYTLSIRLLRIGLLFPMKTEPIEVGKSSLALGTCGEVEQCKAICRPVQAQIHLQHIADGTESDTVQAIIEAVKSLSVTRAFIHTLSCLRFSMAVSIILPSLHITSLRLPLSCCTAT